LQKNYKKTKVPQPHAKPKRYKPILQRLIKQDRPITASGQKFTLFGEHELNSIAIVKKEIEVMQTGLIN